ncbi:MAG: tetratricopeptide repeat protein [Geobacteraceae bacterium]|nr:tetratricopeptide repeat protein [Geobacteraceae bacterium]
MKGKSCYGRFLTLGALMAVLAALAVFYPATGNDFVDLDDLGYIVANPHIRTFDLQMLADSFTGFFEANWHPLTMISLALDFRLWGMDPFGFHLTSIVIHCCSVFLACFLVADLFREAGCFRSGAGEDNAQLSRNGAAAAIAAALFFGLHPLRVESVAWVSERKDVLCLFFMISTMWWHIRHARRQLQVPEERPRFSGAYWMVQLTACLALLSKPAAVSLPLILLVMDWYPLGRISGRASLVRMVAEKLPLMVMTTGAALLTVAAQQYAISRAPEVAPLSRLLVACKALLFYLWQTLWPVGLAPFYPHPGNVHATESAAYLPYLLLVAVISAMVAWRAAIDRKWAALWLYYLAVLLPVLGIIQVGGQWIADRYTYLPALGVSLLWGGGVFRCAELVRQQGGKTAALAVIAIAMLQLSAYTVQTSRMIQVWRNSETLETREISLFPHQVGAAYYSRAKFRNENGRFAEALADIDEALVIARRKQLPDKFSAIHIARADILRNLGRPAEALEAAESAIRESIGQPPEAYVRLREELAIQTESPK